MPLDQIVTAGGTAGLIAVLLYVNVKLGSGAWLSRETIAARTAEVDAAHAREMALAIGERDRAIAVADTLVPAVERLTDALEVARARRR